MKIEIVQLENIRSHIKTTVPFTSGFNCLVGGVGRGKSSVLYAVDFALFGDAIGSRSFEYLIRENADWCKVTVVFTQNGNTYKITRGLRRKGKSITQDVEQLKLYEDDRLLASMKNDAISEQFEAITGLDKELYREIIWFRQEHLKELLDASWVFIGGIAFLNLTCGALTAGVLALSSATAKIENSYSRVARMNRLLRNKNNEAMNEEINNFNRAINYSEELGTWFRSEFGTTACHEIWRFNFSVKKDVENYKSGRCVLQCAYIAKKVAQKVNMMI